MTAPMRIASFLLIAIPNPKQIELIDIDSLETILQEGFDPTLGNGYGTRESAPEPAPRRSDLIELCA